VTAFEIADWERAGWQRRAVAELVRILDTDRDLPVIAWLVGSAGSTLVGRVNAFAPDADRRGMFDAWRMALGLNEHSETSCGAGVVLLRAAGHRDRVRVTLTATVHDDGGGES
jgi:hypothetical protein